MKLTWKEAYRAAYGFLDSIWQRVPEEDQGLLAELDVFLGGMMLREDETCAQPDLMELWHEAVAQITHGGGWGDLTEEEAYQAMTLFLERWAGDHSDGTIQGICQGLAGDSDREEWSQAVRKVLDGEFDPYFGLAEEGQAREVRATLIYLVNRDIILTKKPYTHPWEIQKEYKGYQSSQMSLTCEEIVDFFVKNYGDEENWPIYKEDLLEFFETDQETVQFVYE